MAKFGTILFGTDPIKYGEEAGPGAVLSTKYNYDDDDSSEGSGDESGTSGGTSTDSNTGTGVLKSITDPFGKDYSFQKLENGRRTLYPNNTFTDRTYDEWGRLETIAHKRRETGGAPAGNGGSGSSSGSGDGSGEFGSETVLQSFAYQYDNSGNITKITEADGEYIDYNYDNLNRLTEEHRKTAAGNTIYKIEYLFDNNDAKNGNIHQVTVNDTDTTTFTYDEMNQLTAITHPDSSTETLTFDNNGNLTQTVNNTTGETTTYEWDCFDRLTKVTLPAKGGATSGETVEFEYDSSGMLIGEKSGGMERKFTQQNRFATRETIKNGQDEWETSAMHVIHGTMLATYISATSRRFGGKQQVSHDTKTIFYHSDHLGSVRLITDSHGNIVDSSTTDAYGNPLPRETANPDTPPGSPKNKGAKMLSNFNFVGTHGIRYVEKVKLHNMRARWYNRLDYRFISSDLIKYLNRFPYVDSNPLTSIDISGYSKYYLKKRRDILSQLYFRYASRPEGGFSCNSIARYARDAMKLLFEECECVDFEDFLDIIGIQIVNKFENNPIPSILKINMPGNSILTEDTWYPTMYDDNLAFGLHKEFNLVGSWGNKGFKRQYKDSPGHSSDQAHHYLAYAFLTDYITRFVPSITYAAHIVALAVIEHDFPFGEDVNQGDINLGLRGVETGIFFFNFWFGEMLGPSKYRTDNFKKYGERLLPELRSVCENFPDPSEWEIFYGAKGIVSQTLPPGIR